VGADSTLLRAVVTSGLFETVTGAVMVLGAATAMVLLDPILFLTAGGGLALGLSIAVIFSRRVRPASEAAQARIGEMTSAVERALSAARTIRAGNAEEREIATVDTSAEEAYRAGVRIAKLQALVGPAGIAAIQGAFLLLLGVAGPAWRPAPSPSATSSRSCSTCSSSSCRWGRRCTRTPNSRRDSVRCSGWRTSWPYPRKGRRHVGGHEGSWRSLSRT
jgi:ABC-type multidrug transport system fused ATPase/permease subunit